MTREPVLIVEDEIFVAMDIERILAGAGYPCAGIAADHAEAMAASGRARIALVDVNLRDGATGPAIACELASQGIKIVYVTANPAQIDPIANEAVAYVRKPFRDDAILCALDHATTADASAILVNPDVTLLT